MLGQSHDLDHAEHGEWNDRAGDDLDDDVRGPQTVADHEVERLERLVGLVEPVDEIQHLEEEVDEEGVEEVPRDRVDTRHVDGRASQARVGHVEQQYQRDA